MNRAAGPRAGDGVPDARFDPRRLVGNDQDELGVIALEILGLIGGKADGEVVVIAEQNLNSVVLSFG
jgi:hypothetical protein